MVTESLKQDLVDSAEVTAKKHADWSAINTRFGAERTLMAAVRTSLSLIGFGFTIYKFFEALRKTMGDTGPIYEKGPRRLGMTLVGLGVFVLVAAAGQQWLFLRQLRKETDQKFPWSISLTAAVLLTVTGVVVFVTILVRV